MFHSLAGPGLVLSSSPLLRLGERGLEKGIDVVKIQQLYLLQKTAEGIEGGAGRGFSKPSPLHRTKPGPPGGRNRAGVRLRRRLVSSRPQRARPATEQETARAGDWLGPSAETV